MTTALDKSPYIKTAWRIDHLVAPSISSLIVPIEQYAWFFQLNLESLNIYTEDLSRLDKETHD